MLKSGHTPGTGGIQHAKKKSPAARTRVTRTPKRPPKFPPLARRLYSIPDIAAHLGISTWTVRGLIWKGDLPHVRCGRRILLDIHDVNLYVEHHKQKERT